MDRFYVGNRPANEPPPIYDLYGVINHYGGILGGHYTSYARTPDTLGGIDEQGQYEREIIVLAGEKIANLRHSRAVIINGVTG